MVTNEINWRLKLFDSLSFPTLILAKDQTVVSANKVFLKKFKIKTEKVIGKKCHQIFYNTDKPCSEKDCPFFRVIQDKKSHSVLKRKRTYHPDKVGDVWEDCVFSPLLDDNDELLYVIESIRDVSHTKALERELSGIKEFIERIVESSPSAIIAAQRNGKILLMNQAAIDLFGFNFREKASSHITVKNLYPNGIAKNIMQKMHDNTYGDKGKLPITKTTIINLDAEEIPVEMTAAIIYDDCEEIATMGIYHDLRDKIAVEEKLKNAQKQLAQSEKMASMGQLAAGVAHEINNPLSGIMLYSNLSLEKLKPDDLLYEYMTYIIEDSNRCKDIVKNLLIYSRQTEPNKNIIQINELVKHALNLIRDQKLFAHIELKKEMSDEMMLVNVDNNQINQVIINLVMNAIDAMQEQGVLILRTYRDAHLKKVYFEVGDTGGGISGPHLTKLFDPFFTTKEPGKGTGLGLSTAYGFMQENNGEIEVKKTSPEGTTFLLTMPLFKPQ